MFNEYKFRCAECGQSGVCAVIWSRPRCCDQPMIPVGKPEHEDRDLVVKPGTICPVCKVSELKQSKTHCGGCRSEISRMDVPRVPRPKPDPAPQPSREREDQTQPTGTAVGQAVSYLAMAAGTYDLEKQAAEEVPKSAWITMNGVQFGWDSPMLHPHDRLGKVELKPTPDEVPVVSANCEPHNEALSEWLEEHSNAEPVHNYQTASGDHCGVPESVRAAIRREVLMEVAKHVSNRKWSSRQEGQTKTCPRSRRYWSGKEAALNAVESWLHKRYEDNQ